MESDQYDPEILAQLLAIGAQSDYQWTEKELGEILEHQLQGVLSTQLLLAVNRISEEPSSSQKSVNWPTTFSDALLSSHTTVEILREIKDHFKALFHSENHGFPEDVAMALYYAALASAFVRFGIRISSLDDQSFHDGLNSLIQKSWISAELCRLYAAAVSALGGKCTQHPGG